MEHNHKISNKLAGLQVNPPQHSWDRIEQNIRMSRGRAKAKTFSYWLVSSAAILLGFVVAFTVLKPTLYNNYEPELMSLTVDPKVHNLYNLEHSVELMEAYKKLETAKNQL
jgi:hypothetical protein